MRSPRSLLVLSVALLVAATGCDMFSDDNANGGLVNTAWTVASIDGQATLPDAPPTLVFAPDGLSGTTGCNSYGGTFRTDGDRITILVSAMTEMACDGPRGDQEARVLAALPAATTWRLHEDGALELGGGTTIVADPAPFPGVPAAVDPNQAVTDGALAGTSWVLVGIVDTVDLAGIAPTIAFAADGSVAGLAGCNRFNGPYAVDGAALTFGGLTTTKMACGAPADAVERAYLAALAKIEAYAIDPGGQLVLDGTAGRLIFFAVAD